MAAQIYEEYLLHMRAVKETFSQFIYEFDASDRSQSDIANHLSTMLKIRFRTNSVKRPPRIILLGGPGSGRSTQSQMMADRFGLVNVSPELLLKQEIETNPAVKLKIQTAQDNG